MSGSFKDFLPKGYSHLYVYDKNRKNKFEVNVEHINFFYAMSEKETVISFNEGNKRRLMITPYTLRQIFTVFSEGKIE